MAGVLQEAGDGDSRAGTRSQVQVEYIIMLYTSISIRLLHLCQGSHAHYVITTYDRWMGRLRGDSFILGFEWQGTESGYHSFSIFCSVFALLVIVLPWLVHGSCCVSCIVSFLLSLSLVPLIRRY